MWTESDEDENYLKGFERGYMLGRKDGYYERLMEEPYDHGEKSNDPDTVSNVYRVNLDD